MSYDLTPPRQEIGVSAGTAFKIGFFGFLGAFVASLIIGIILLVISVVIGAIAGVWITSNL